MEKQLRLWGADWERHTEWAGHFMLRGYGSSSYETFCDYVEFANAHGELAHELADKILNYL